MIVPIVMTIARLLHRGLKMNSAEIHDTAPDYDAMQPNERFDPDTYNDLRNERNKAAEAHEWTRFQYLRQQLRDEMAKPGDESLKDAVARKAAKEAWAGLTSEVGEGLNQLVAVARDVWNAFRMEFEHGYERAKQERQRGDQYDGRQQYQDEQQSTGEAQRSSSFEKMWGCSAHETLGIRRDASPIEIKKAWAKEMTKYHPDRVNQSDAAAVKDATEKAKQINMARVEMEECYREECSHTV